MTSLLDQLVLERTGPADASVGLISLPLPRESAGALAIDHPLAAMEPVAWWERHRTPRRALAMIVDRHRLPDTLRLVSSAGSHTAPASSAWTVSTHLVREKLDFKPPKFYDIASLRGVPAEDCTTVEFEVVLQYGQRELRLQCGATDPTGRERNYFWQNVQVDRLWNNAAAQAVRVGGVIYNGDTYLWADVFLMLFANGVARAAAHFVNTKLHIEGYDFQGLPLIRFAGKGIKPVSAILSTHGPDFDLGNARLNLAEAMQLSGAEYPSRLDAGADDVVWRPVSRTFNPQVETAPVNEWPAGFARTVRFDLSLSDAAPKIARYRAPSWWYAVAGEPWSGGYLPVKGKLQSVASVTAEYVRSLMRRNQFDAGNAGLGNDGFAGIGLLQHYYQSGDPDFFQAGLDYCHYWADIAVDHTDFSVHQWIGGWPWKTCAYSKFRDVLFGYLETGDPYFLDAVENAADAYWMWFRSNWPRNTIGRDAFEVGGWGLLRRYLRSERARERTREFVRMIGVVLDTRGMVGGQLGAGPHPGYISSIYMTGVCMNSLSDIAEAEFEEGCDEGVAAAYRLILKLHERWMRDDVELFPSSYGAGGRDKWGEVGQQMWVVVSGRVYSLAARLAPRCGALAGAVKAMAEAGFRKMAEQPSVDVQRWAPRGRLGDNMLNPLYHDALRLGATIKGHGVELSPVGDLSTGPSVLTVATPWGELKVNVRSGAQPSSPIFVASAQREAAIG
ncbi:MAG: hypothetical protein IT444_00730 [Phycisphaeraceae bacterium]|nr:hypothetical protein [Phycisphaeraceae bacterium]